MMTSFLGWFGEKKVAFYLWLYLDSNLYPRIHNVIIPSRNGTIQIDHIIISSYGVFIIETKNIKGWIFGSSNQPQWTQVIFGKKYKFQNPLRQIFRQKRGLSEYLGISETYIHTIVYFASNCNFKTAVPPNVIKSGLCEEIKQYSFVVLNPDEINHIRERLNEAKSDRELTTRKHIKYLNERFASNITCPECGSRLIVRTSMKGNNVGSKFLGCENYPRCKFTKNINS
ncbi:MAG: NERD domain-containing protein [Bacteroidetes bacterium]|nr:NERD domain-containing protein [Bacteroidota bacterium]